ncbi:GTP-binding protein [Streptomyces armeniacus]|uniref:GTP-binding protein n=1 Tax=Streptomyces armeniacus TaxID=83291 RepID=A0A345XSZ2_9ACTN|nr:TetM/TetW/TetO/TetS family tetracycline resistance ribosomal protection protein [Streptomyces armeniacus]AXK34758.1 GTP-binding protein [Streptomyces armeniacus]
MTTQTPGSTPAGAPATTLNLGILAHVDAGKTSLTERLLYDNGAIAELGSVDAGSTQTDTGEVERERGITVRSAVAAFATRGVQVNLVDTPGHPDFIAEVERALSVLDGAVLVLSAVEGVQAQTRVLMRSLRKLRLPTLIFVNKIDRAGARDDALLADVRRHLAPHLAPRSAVRGLGTPAARAVARSLDEADERARVAEVAAEHDDALLARLVDGAVPSRAELERVLAAQTAAGLLHPVWFGSALTGEGTGELTEGIRTFLPPPAPETGGPRGTVFAVERGEGGKKTAYLRLFSGEVRERQRLTFRRREPGGATGGFSGRVTGLDVVGAPTAHGPGARAARPVLTAGSIGRLRGLAEVRVGDLLGEPDGRTAEPHFSPPSLETVVRPARPVPEQETRLHAALAALADEDPLIRTRPAGDGATSVLLYGAVQREVIAARLRAAGVEPVFERIKPVYFERPAGTGESVTEIRRHGGNDFWATVGLRVEPAPPGSGVGFVRDVEWGALPRAFHRAIEETVFRTLRQGLYGWEVTDCRVTLTRVGYLAPASVAADFRHLTPVVLLRALESAGSRVYEPCQSVEIEVPADVLSGVVGALSALGADIAGSAEQGASWLVTAELPTRLVQELTVALPGLTHGEGALWSRPGTDRAVRGAPPERERLDGNPLRYEEYLRFLADRSLSRTDARTDSVHGG